MTLLFKRDTTDPEPWLAALASQLPDREIRVFPKVEPREEIEFALVYAPPAGSRPDPFAVEAVVRRREASPGNRADDVDLVQQPRVSLARRDHRVAQLLQHPIGQGGRPGTPAREGQEQEDVSAVPYGGRRAGAVPGRPGRNVPRNRGSPDSPFRRRSGSLLRPDGPSASGKRDR